MLAVPWACDASDAPAGAPPPALAEATSEIGTALHVRVRQRTIELNASTTSTLELRPGDDLTPLTRALEQLVPKDADSTGPVTIAVDPEVPGEWVLFVLRELARVGWSEPEVELGTSRRVPVSLPNFCGCIADVPTARCVHPQVAVHASGIAIGSFPTRRGPCPNAVLSLAASAAPVLAPSPPLDRPRLVIEDPSQCRDGRTPYRSIDAAELQSTLRRVHALAPGCPFSVLRVGPEVAWSQVEPVIDVLGHELGWSITLELAATDVLGCEATLLASELPAPWRGPEAWPPATARCRDGAETP